MFERQNGMQEWYPFLHSSSIAQISFVIERRIKDVEYLAAFSHDFFELGRTSIIYGVTDIIFSLKQHISPSGKLFCRSIIIPLPELWPIRNMLYYCSDSAQGLSLALWRGLGALVRQLSFYGPVSLYLGILRIQLSRCVQPWHKFKIEKEVIFSSLV